MSDAATVLPPFHVWIRRAESDAFDLRFTVSSGRALLRTVRPGITVDPPAQSAGEVAGLDAIALHSSVFLHIEPVRLAAAPYPLAELDAAELGALPAGVWVAVERGPGGLRIGGADPAPLITLAPPPPEADDAAEASDAAAPPTGLVRHLRRQLARQAARIAELEEDVRRLRGR